MGFRQTNRRSPVSRPFSPAPRKATPGFLYWFILLLGVSVGLVLFGPQVLNVTNLHLGFVPASAQALQTAFHVVHQWLGEVRS